MKPDSANKPEDARRLRSRTISRVAVVAASIVALLAGLLLFESNIPGAPPGAGAGASILDEHSPRIGVAIATQPPAAEQSIAPDLALAVGVAPDPAQEAIDGLSNASSGEAPASVPEGSSVAQMPVKQFEPRNYVAPKTGRQSQASDLLKEDSLSPTLQNHPSRLAVESGPATKVGGSFVVQLGVFSSTENAEDLRGKLQQAGIVAKLETRVQVGPFASREDALRAQERLRKLGLGNGMLITAAKRP